ncbi:MAG: response regulator transcription factor [Clostridia bacterium]|nr:response regulator transcription factor [Clostridia bacterium]
MSYKIALLDDEAHQLEATAALTRQLLAQEGLDAAVVPFQGVFNVPALAFDAYLLDISMPGVDGMVFASQIRGTGSAAPIIFITSIENRVYEAFRVQPLRFVRKNHLKEELPEAIHALCDQLRQEEKTALSFQSEGMLLRLPISRILYVESSDKVQRVVMADRTYEARTTMAFFEEQLLPQGFFRIHRCYLVNMQAVYSVTGSDVVLASGEKLPISRFKLAQTKEEFKRMMFRD